MKSVLVFTRKPKTIHSPWPRLLSPDSWIHSLRIALHNEAKNNTLLKSVLVYTIKKLCASGEAILGTLKYLPMQLHRYYKGITKVLQRYYARTTKVLQRYYKYVTKVLQRDDKGTTKVSQSYYKGITQVLKRWYNGIIKMIRQGNTTRYSDKVLRQGMKTRYQNKIVNNRLSNIFVQLTYWGEVLRSVTCFPLMFFDLPRVLFFDLPRKSLRNSDPGEVLVFLSFSFFFVLFRILMPNSFFWSL